MVENTSFGVFKPLVRYSIHWSSQNFDNNNFNYDGDEKEKSVTDEGLWLEKTCAQAAGHIYIEKEEKEGHVLPTNGLTSTSCLMLVNWVISKTRKRYNEKLSKKLPL